MVSQVVTRLYLGFITRINTMIKAFLFDLDGTLFDTIEANVHAYHQAFNEVGLTFDEAKYRELFGLRYPEMMHSVAPLADQSQLAQVKQRKSYFYQESLHIVIPNDGLLALQASVRPTFKTALVSTASHNNVYSLLAYFKLGDLDFDTVITGEHVANGKPDPECYLQAIEHLQVTGSECCVFEDSEVGVQAAARSGAQVIRVQM